MHGKAWNIFGESRTATTVIVAVPPSIIKEVSPSSVICEKQTLCFLPCLATSYTPFNYSWTKGGQVPIGDNIKIMNNSIIVTPHDTHDYGVYVCHATNGFGSTAYKITLLALKDDDVTKNILFASVIALSSIVVVMLIIIGVLIWQRRRAVPNKTILTKDYDGVDLACDQQPRDQHVSEPGTYMELHPRPSDRQAHAPTEYQALQGNHGNPGYYNVEFQKESKGKPNEEVYEEVGSSHS